MKHHASTLHPQNGICTSGSRPLDTSYNAQQTTNEQRQFFAANSHSGRRVDRVGRADPSASRSFQQCAVEAPITAEGSEKVTTFLRPWTHLVRAGRSRRPWFIRPIIDRQAGALHITNSISPSTPVCAGQRSLTIHSYSHQLH